MKQNRFQYEQAFKVFHPQFPYIRNLRQILVNPQELLVVSMHKNKVPDLLHQTVGGSAEPENNLNSNNYRFVNKMSRNFTLQPLLK